jgi:NitT/TauT family transport system permease protein
MMNEEASVDDSTRGADAVALVRGWFESNGLALVIVGLLVVVWQIVSTTDDRGNVFLPTPQFTVNQVMESQDQVVNAIRITTTEVLLGFTVAVVVGITLGILVAEVASVRQFMFPTIILGYSMPHAILAPVFIIWFGNGFASAALFIGWIAFFVVLINTITGINQMSSEFNDLGSVLGASKWQMIRKIKFWEALPHIANGVKIAALQSVVAAIIIEFLGGQQGLGWYIINAVDLGQTGLLFGVLFIIMVFALVFFKTIELVLEFLTPDPMDV